MKLKQFEYRLLKLGAMIKISNGCWIWQGRISDGYGFYKFGHRKRSSFAHRLIYEILVGKIPRGLVIRHMCHNRKCVSPFHMKVGTIADNNNDTLKAGNHFFSKRNKCKNGHEFKPGSYRMRKNTRICKICVIKTRIKSSEKALVALLDANG